MIINIFIIICILSCTTWAFEDFYKSIWTPNQRLATGLLYALVAFCITVTSFGNISTTENWLMSVAMVIMFIAVLLVEGKATKQSILRNAKDHKNN